MVQIFVTGGTGYIGYEVALALRRAGHSVFALTRTANSQLAISLLQNEVHLVVGDLLKPETYLDIATSSTVLIHVAADYSQFDKVDNLTAETFFEAVRVSNQKGGARKLIIYTSGILVYPASKVATSTEETPVDPPAFLKGRVAVEQRFLSATEADGLVFRPGFVYGKRPIPMIYDFFLQASKGEEVYTKSNLDAGMSHIHVDDVASAYVSVVDSPRDKVAGQAFNLTDDSRTTNGEVAKVFSAKAGYSGPIVAHPERGWDLANTNVYVSSQKLKNVTGWTLKHKQLLEEADLFYEHWKATVAHPYPTSSAPSS